MQRQSVCWSGQGREKVASGEREGSTVVFDSACSLVSIS